MNELSLIIAYDRRAQIVRKIELVRGTEKTTLHPMYFAYAQITQHCAQATRMMIVRMLMNDHPLMDSHEAAAIARALMMGDYRRLVTPEISNEHKHTINVQFANIDEHGNIAYS